MALTAAPMLSFERLRRPLLLAGMLAGCLILGFLLANRPWLAMGAGGGAVILVLLLLRPLVVLGALLALGAYDLSFMTGGFNVLFPGLGGLDMNGIRLIGVVAGLSALVLVHRDFADYAFDRHGRWYVVFLVFAAATLVYTLSVVDGLRLFFKLAYPFLMFVAIRGVVRERGQLERLVDWVLIGGIVLTVLIDPVYVMAGGYDVDAAGRIRVQSMGLHENPFSFYLLMLILISFARYTVRGQLRYLALCGLFGIWLVLTLTRITFLAGMAGLAGVALFGALVARNYRAVLGAGVVAAALAVPLVPVALERSLGYIPGPAELLSLLADPMTLIQSINWQGRLVLWGVIFSSVASSPVIGHGLGSSTALIFATLPGWAGVVHNEYLRLLVDTGIIGSVLFAIAVLAWCAGALQAGRVQDAQAREFALPAFAGIVAWSIIAVTDNAFDYYAPFTQYIAFLCAGALSAAGWARLEAEQETGD
ncbi:MAG TPA: O-antigen ligase family protein [Longimicrobiales bacterium]